MLSFLLRFIFVLRLSFFAFVIASLSSTVTCLLMSHLLFVRTLFYCRIVQVPIYQTVERSFGVKGIDSGILDRRCSSQVARKEG